MSCTSLTEDCMTDPIHVPSVRDTHCDNVDPNDKIIVILQQHVRLDKTSSNMGLELLSRNMSKFSFCNIVGSELGIPMSGRLSLIIHKSTYGMNFGIFWKCCQNNFQFGRICFVSFLQQFITLRVFALFTLPFSYDPFFDFAMQSTIHIILGRVSWCGLSQVTS